MTAACYDQLLSGLPATPPDRFTLAFGGFGEPTVHPRWMVRRKQNRNMASNNFD